MSTLADVLSDIELSEMFAAEIPCGGIEALGKPPCGRAAVLRVAVHPNCVMRPTPADFKCADCYSLFITDTAKWLAKRGYICCRDCKQFFTSLEAFVRYFPL